MVNIKTTDKELLMFTKSNVSSYLSAHKDAWALTTMRSKTSLLNKMQSKFGDCKSKKVIDYIESHYKPYSQKTNLIHLSAYVEWLKNNKKYEEENGFASRIRGASYKFKTAYEKRLPEISFKEAKEKINSIHHPEVRRLADILINTGLRVSELWKVDHAQGRVLGKGAKNRGFYGNHFEAPKISVTFLRTELAKYDLKPHDLRKLFATFLVNNNYPIHEVCAIMGWSSFETAQFYLQIRSKDKLKVRLQQDLENDANGGQVNDRRKLS